MLFLDDYIVFELVCYISKNEKEEYKMSYKIKKTSRN